MSNQPTHPLEYFGTPYETDSRFGWYKTKQPLELFDIVNICEGMGVEINLFISENENCFIISQWIDANQYLVYAIPRTLLIEYLEYKCTLRDLIEDEWHTFSIVEFVIDSTGTHYKLKHRAVDDVSIEKLGEYMPTKDSFFDLGLSNINNDTRKIIIRLLENMKFS